MNVRGCKRRNVVEFVFILPLCKVGNQSASSLSLSDIFQLYVVSPSEDHVSIFDKN